MADVVGDDPNLAERATCARADHARNGDSSLVFQIGAVKREMLQLGASACLEGRGAVAAARRLIGPTDPRDAPPGTIRGDLATHWRRNLVHASASADATARRSLTSLLPGAS